MNHPVVERTATACLVDDLNLNESHIGTVGLEAERILNGRKSQMVRGSGRFDSVAADLLSVMIAHSLDGSGLISHVVEGEQECVGATGASLVLAVDGEADAVGRRNDIYGFDRSCGIVPVTDYICVALLWVHPSVPHHMMGEKSVLGYAHRIDNATGTVVRLATVMGICVGEDYFHSAGAHPRSRSGPFLPVFVPPAYELAGHSVTVMVIFQGRLATIERAVAFLMIGITI